MNEAFKKIAGEIGNTGPISFARFMELALYCPVYGYYETEKDTIGRRGDYYTSVSVGSLFGELLAFQFAEWLEQEDARLKAGVADSSRLLCQLVEAGAHTGQIARDILAWMRDHRPNLFQHLEYWIIEPSERRREWQRKILSPFLSKVHWANSQCEFGARSEFIPPRVIFANELLDAMPVHRFGWDAHTRAWFEWGVALKDGEFIWTRLAVSTLQPFVISHPFSHELLNVLPNGYIVETSPAAEDWWRTAAGLLRRGRFLTFDYGLTSEELFTPERPGGTLRAYRNHQSSTDLLAHPGEQDLTAHVNFSAIQSAGEKAGLTTETFTSQEQFLTGIVSKISEGKAAFGEWTPPRTRQFQTLTHPQHLGRSFRVLVQRREDA